MPFPSLDDNGKTKSDLEPAKSFMDAQVPRYGRGDKPFATNLNYTPSPRITSRLFSVSLTTVHAYSATTER